MQNFKILRTPKLLTDEKAVKRCKVKTEILWYSNIQQYILTFFIYSKLHFLFGLKLTQSLTNNCFCLKGL